jgi:hypothetical protein
MFLLLLVVVVVSVAGLCKPHLFCWRRFLVCAAGTSGTQALVFPR